jgi:hypothetical protein
LQRRGESGLETVCGCPRRKAQQSSGSNTRFRGGDVPHATTPSMTFPDGFRTDIAPESSGNSRLMTWRTALKTSSTELHDWISWPNSVSLMI